MNVADIPSLSPKINEQKKMQEKAKRELDAIIQSWKDHPGGDVPGSGTEKNVHPLQDLHESFPSGGEEIEGSNCSSLKYLYENNTIHSTSSLNGQQSVQKISITSEVQGNELQFATELCHQAGEVLNSPTNHSSMCLEEDKNLSKDSKAKEISVSAVSAAPSSEKEPVSAISRSNDSMDSPDKDSQKKHLCNLCGKHYKSSSHLSRHMKTAHGNNQAHLCYICNSSFTRSESLMRHLRMHEQRDGTDKRSKQGPYKCPKCHKSYQQPYNVTRHLLSHSGVKPFKCTECNKSFTQYTGLSRHLVLHKGSRDFECKECGKSFARLFVLNRHMLTHSDDKPYKCFVCSKSFIRASQLSTHVNSHQKKKAQVVHSDSSI